MIYHDISWHIMTFCHKDKNIIFVAKTRHYDILSRKFMITRLLIAFEDLLGSSIAPQVVPHCSKSSCGGTQSRKFPLDMSGRLWHRGSCRWWNIVRIGASHYFRGRSLWLSPVLCDYLSHWGESWVSGRFGTRIYVPDRGPRPKKPKLFSALFMAIYGVNLFKWHSVKGSGSSQNATF